MVDAVEVPATYYDDAELVMRFYWLVAVTGQAPLAHAACDGFDQVYT